MTAVKPNGRERNTYGLPQGEQIRRELVRWFREQRRAIMVYLRTGRMSQKDMETLPVAWPDWDDFQLGTLTMSERMTPKLEAIWDEQGSKFTAKIGLDANDWEVNNPHVQAAIDKASLDFCESTNATTSLELADALTKTREALAAGLIEGNGIVDLTRRIAEIFDGAETWRARRIATTEASRATHSAQEMAAIQSGVVTGWKWMLSEDACPLCQTVARRVPAVKLGGTFAVIGSNPTYATIKHPPLHPYCQCALEEILDIDQQPKQWSPPLVDPKPEEEDYAPGEAPESARTPRKPPPKAVKPKPATPVKVKPKGPTGKPVGEALEVDMKTPKMTRAVNEAVAAIDRVHGDGNLPKIPVQEISRGNNSGQLVVRKGRPEGIDVHKAGETPRITTAHEIGHFLDWSGIKSEHRGSLGQVDQRKDPRFKGFLEAVDKSDAIQSLKDLRYKNSVTVTQGKLTSTCKVDKKYVDYLLSDHEVFARAYSQWVATRSEDPDMMAELDHMLRFGEKRTYKEQWSHEDFKSIAAEIDKLFKGFGWLK